MGYGYDDSDDYNVKYYIEKTQKTTYIESSDVRGYSLIIALVILGLMAIITAVCTCYYMRRKKIIHAGRVHQHIPVLNTTRQPAYQVSNELQRQPQLPQQIPPNNFATGTHYTHETYPIMGTGADQSSAPLMEHNRI